MVRNLFTLLLALSFLLPGGCAKPRPTNVSTGSDSETSAKVGLQHPTQESHSDDYIVRTAVSGDSYDSLARAYLGDDRLAYLISEFNKNAPIVPGVRIVIPLKPENPGGIYSDGYLAVPVLCYHRFSVKKSHDKITIAEETFEQQMAYLKNNGYTTITLRQLSDFMELKRRPPQKSVVITIDDGLKSAKTIAYPILKKYGFNAVLFIPTDNIKSKQNSLTLTWADLQELKESGVFEIESHTVLHSDLTKVSAEKVNTEIYESQRKIKSMLGINACYMAYPFGLFNKGTIDAMRQHGYKGGFTVIRGANFCYHSPYAINRSMVYNRSKIEEFTRMLNSFKPDKQEEAGEIVRTVEKLNIALTIDPENKTAREELTKFVVKQNTEAQVHFLAGASLRGSNPQKAHKEFIAAIMLRSNYSEALTALRELHLASMESILYSRLKREAANAAAKLHDKHADVDEGSYSDEYSLETAVSAFEAGDYATAIREFEKMKSAYPDDPDILAYLDRSWYNSGVDKFNKRDYRKALTVFSNVRKGFERVDEFLLICRQNLKGMLNDYFTAGVKSYNDNRFKDAVGTMKIVLEIDPNHKKAKEYLENSKKTA